MTDYRKYTDYIIEQAEKLLSIDSPSGYCRQVTDYLLEELDRLGIQAKRTVKGGVVASFGGKNKEDGILLEAHCDTLGGMVAEIKANGSLRLTNIGGMKPANAAAVGLAAMAAMMAAVNDRASRVEMPMPDNSLGIYRQTPATGK